VVEVADKKGCDETEGNPRKAYDIGYDLVFQVDEGDNDQGGAEDEQGKEGEGWAEFHEEEEGQQRIDKLHQRVLYGDGPLAGTAFPAQDEIAKNRDIVVKGYLEVTVRAVGRREDDRLVAGESADADIQKGADHGAEDEGEDVKGDGEDQLCSMGIDSNSFKPANLLE